MNRGKLVIVLIVGVGVLAAGFSVWYHYRAQQNAQTFWGTTTAVLIAEGPHVEVLRLAAGGIPKDDMPPPATDEKGEPAAPTTVQFAGQHWEVTTARPADKARGLANVRRALVVDSTFDWQHTPDQPDPEWQYALAFDNQKLWATLLFDFDSRQIALTDGRKTALLNTAANDELRKFFEEQFVDEAATPAESAPTDSAPAEAPKEEASQEKPSDEKPPEEKSVQPADEQPAADPTDEKPAAAPIP